MSMTSWIVALPIVLLGCASSPAIPTTPPADDSIESPSSEGPQDASAAPAIVAEDSGAPDAMTQTATAAKTPAPLPKQPPPVPIKAPLPGATGCVTPEQFSTYVQALETHAKAALDKALADQGAVFYERTGFLLGGLGGGYQDDEGPPLGVPYEVKGKRFVNVGYSEFDTKATLAKQGDALHLLELQARSNRIMMKVCGVNPCPHGRGTMVRQRPLIINLEPGESMGPPLVLNYDTWWVFPEYTKAQRCQPVP